MLSDIRVSNNYNTNDYVFMTADTRISGLVYRTVKEPIEMYQKQHIASVLAGVSVILLNQLIVGIAFSCLWESIYMSLGLIFLKAVTNIFSVIKHDAFRSIVYVISGLPLFVYTICMTNLFEKKFFDRYALSNYQDDQFLYEIINEAINNFKTSILSTIAYKYTKGISKYTDTTVDTVTFKHHKTPESIINVDKVSPPALKTKKIQTS